MNIFYSFIIYIIVNYSLVVIIIDLQIDILFLWFLSIIV